MSLLSDNIVPGNHGKIFSANTNLEEDLLDIKNTILKISGIKNVVINRNVFPNEFTIFTSSMVKVEKIENEIKKLGYHLIPKEIFKT